MSVNQVDKQTGNTSLVAGGTLYADAPIGAIQAFGGSSAPAGWLLCQGQAISRTTYAALFAVIGTAYGAGDGSTTFNLPDPREAALVGAGTNVLNAGSIAAHNAVNLGAFQDDQFQTHAHHVYINNDPNYPVLSNKNLKADGEDYWNVNPSGTYPIVASTEYEGNRAGTTTHGKQLGVNYIIKAQQVALPLDIEEAVDEKVSKFSGTSGGNTYVTVDQLAYDQTNKTLGLKVNGADTVIPFKKDVWSSDSLNRKIVLFAEDTYRMLAFDNAQGVMAVNEDYFEVESKTILPGSNRIVSMTIKPKKNFRIRLIGGYYNGTFGFEPLYSTTSQITSINQEYDLVAGSSYTWNNQITASVENASACCFGVVVSEN